MGTITQQRPPRRRAIDEGDEKKPFVPGTSGWTVADLDDPAYVRQFSFDRHEICDGVLTIMPAAFFDGGSALFNVCLELTNYLRVNGDPDAQFATEADVVINKLRIPKLDAVYLSPADRLKQSQTKRTGRGRRALFGRVTVVPTLAIESISIGHEDRDRLVKYEWYERFGIPNYWIVDVYKRTIECFALVDGRYELDVIGKTKGVIRPRAFPGFALDLAKVWPRV